MDELRWSAWMKLDCGDGGGRPAGFFLLIDILSPSGEIKEVQDYSKLEALVPKETDYKRNDSLFGVWL